MKDIGVKKMITKKNDGEKNNLWYLKGIAFVAFTGQYHYKF